MIDASVALAWCFPDEANDYADAALLAVKGQALHVPSIWPVELTNALLVGERRKRIRHAEVRRFMELLQGLHIVQDGQSVSETINNLSPLAHSYSLTAYDAAYLDVAIRHGLPLATFDGALLRAARAADIMLFKG